MTKTVFYTVSIKYQLIMSTVDKFTITLYQSRSFWIPVRKTSFKRVEAKKVERGVLVVCIIVEKS